MHAGLTGGSVYTRIYCRYAKLFEHVPHPIYLYEIAMIVRSVFGSKNDSWWELSTVRSTEPELKTYVRKFTKKLRNIDFHHQNIVSLAQVG